MDILKEKGHLIIKNVIDFDIAQTLECGQCFHFKKIDEMEYGVVAYDKLLHIYQEGDTLYLYNIEKMEDAKFWCEYFDLYRDYGKIKKELLSKDRKLEEAINDKWGVRLINQEFIETLMSFIISQNKQIPHIKKIVSDISAKYGKYLGDIKGTFFYSFPDVKELSCISIEDYKELKTGFRAPYLKDASDKLVSYIDIILCEDLSKNILIQDRKRLDSEIKHYFSLKSEDEARDMLKNIKGVGDKVANCVMLFSLGFRSSFPIDVWIKRIMENMYFEGKDITKEKIDLLARDLYGEYAGYAQQYIFFHGRDTK